MTYIADTSTAVVVLRSVAYAGLNVIRSLGRLGVPVYNIDPNPFAPAFFSRYCRGGFFGDVEQWPVDRTLDYLRRVREKIGRPCILVPTTDYTSMFVSRNRGELKGWFNFAEMPYSSVHSLSDKKQMYHVAREYDIPVPATVFPQSRDDVQIFLKDATFPVMLKAIDGRRLWQRTGEKMVIVRSESELLEKYDEMEEPGDPNLMLQEYIPGGDDTIWMFNGYFNEESKCLVSFTGRKIRQYPIHRGVTSLGVCLSNSVITDLTVPFLEKYGYRGIVDLGYRYDQRDGRYKILDINPRIGATFRLFVDSYGMDVARALYLDLTGQPVVPREPLEGRRWVVEDFDFVSSVRYRLEGKLSFREWLASLRNVEETAYFAPDDITPIFPMLLAGFYKLLSESGQFLARMLGLRRRLIRLRVVRRIRGEYRLQK
jgi:D-aspartate ligase